MTVKATVNKNGPVKIEGEIELFDSAGKPYTLAAGKPVFLCRCGMSAKKPFCDGTHGRQGFESTVDCGIG